MHKHSLFIIVFLTIFCFLTLNFPANTITYAKEYQQDKTGYDIIFVLDVSGSMEDTDKNRNSIEIIKMMIDMCTTGNTRVGFIAYNDRINSFYPLADVSNTALRNNLKKAVDQSKFTGYSDMGIGLRKSIDLFSESKDIGNQPIIILLSDGETDLSGSNTGRTEKDSEKDIKTSITKAKKKQVPIYTIGLTGEQNTNLDFLKDISDQTGGISYTAATTYQLVDIFNGILSKNISSLITPVKNETATGKTQYFDVEVSDESLSELNIMLFSDNALDVSEVLTSSKKVSVVPSASYQLIKITDPVMETIRIAAKDTKGASIRISTLGVYSFSDVLIAPDTLAKDKSTIFSFHFFDTIKKSAVTDDKLYKNLSFDFYINDLATGEETKFPAIADAKGFHMEKAFEKPGKYTIRADYSGKSFFGQTDGVTFEVTNTSPVKTKELKETIAKESGIKTYDISTLFKDSDNDSLTYECIEKKGEDMDISLWQNQLSITPKAYGDTILSIQATDTSGATCISMVMIRSIPIWQYYKKITAAIMIAVILLITGIVSFFTIRYFKKRISMPKPAFVGCLVGYFITTKNQMEIPPLKWQLTDYPNKGISLARLLKARSIDLPLPDADKIWFSPKAGNTIELIHSTRCTVLVGTRAVQRNTPAIITMGEKIYIAFEDMENELEIRYKNS